MQDEIRVDVPLEYIIKNQDTFSLIETLKEAGVPTEGLFDGGIKKGYLYKKYSNTENVVTYIWRLHALPRGKELPLVSS